MRPRTGSKQLIREINEALVMDTVRLHGTVARTTISQTTGLSPATVTGLTGRLLATGYLQETPAASTGGRPAQLLSLSADGAVAVGVRLSPSEAYATGLNLRGEVVCSHREPWSGGRARAAEVAISRAVRSVLERCDPARPVMGVGIAVSGVVDHASGVVKHSGSLHWENVPLRERLEARLALPVVVDNYVNSLALGLVLFDPGVRARDAMIISVGASIGMSLIVNGRVYRGARGTAGGLAHTRVSPPRSAGRPCHCGASGCLETFSSQWGIGQELERRGSPMKADDIAANSDGPVVSAVLDEAASALGVTLASAAKLFGPHSLMIALASGVNVERLRAGIRSAFDLEYEHHSDQSPLLEMTSVDDTAWARGAGCGVLARVFQVDVDEDSREATVS